MYYQNAIEDLSKKENTYNYCVIARLNLQSYQRWRGIDDDKAQDDLSRAINSAKRAEGYIQSAADMRQIAKTYFRIYSTIHSDGRNDSIARVIEKKARDYSFLGTTGFLLNLFGINTSFVRFVKKEDKEPVFGLERIVKRLSRIAA